LASCFLIEVIATFFFLYVIIGTTSKGAAVGFAGIPIGLCLTLIHLFLIPAPMPRSIQRGAPARHSLRAVPISHSSGCSGWRPSSVPRSLDLSAVGSMICLT
jgi:hypothetical protein